MPQRKKAKTKKAMKKSINSLWKSLQEEKAKHAKASALVGRMKTAAQKQYSAMQGMTDTIRSMGHELINCKNERDITANAMADLVKRIT